MRYGLFVQRQRAVVRVTPNLGRIFPRLNTGARRTAQRLASEGILKADPLPGQAIKIGRQVQRLSIATAGIPALLIAEKENDVGSLH